MKTEVSPFPYEGPEGLRQPIEDALRGVVDPEVALSIVDVGLIYGVVVNDDQVQVRLTMTSAACPVADVMMEDIGSALDRVLPPGMQVDLDLVWDPPWTTDRMSLRAKAFLGW